jgi:hypothetical protein
MSSLALIVVLDLSARLLGKVISKCHNLIFYTKIDDHCVRRGDTGQIIARWRRLVASRVALDLFFCRLVYTLRCFSFLAVRRISPE